MSSSSSSGKVTESGHGDQQHQEQQQQQQQQQDQHDQQQQQQQRPMKAYARASVVRDTANSSPVRLDYVEFHGVQRTKYDALLKEVGQLFKSTTLGGLIVNSDVAARHLEEVGLFTKAVAAIDISEHDETGYAVEFYVKEPRRSHFRANAGITNAGEGEGSVSFDKGSVFGRAEAVTASISRGHRGTSMFNVGAVKPLLGWQRYTNVALSVYRQFTAAPWSHYEVTGTGAALELNFRSLRRLQHSLRWTGSWRHLHPTTAAAFAVREHAGHTMKSSVEHVLAFDTRNSISLATRGLLSKLTQEYAGIFGGDVGFVRHRFDFEAASPLPLDGLILSTGFFADYVSPFRGRTLHLLDRCYLGGPSNLRGFAHNGVGPRADRSFVGGMASWGAGIHLYRPLVPPTILFAHAFAVCGSVHGVAHDAGVSDVIKALSQQPRASAGLGLVVNIAEGVRLELNYVVPLSYSVGDDVRGGLQFGVGVSFL